MANQRPHGGDPPHPVTRICVCSDPAALSAVRREFVAAGWTSSPMPDLLADPRRSVGARDLCVEQLEDAAGISGVADLLLSGISVAVLACDPPLATDVFDQCRRIATAEWFDSTHRPVAEHLSDEQLALLLAIRDGDDVEQAARRYHLSPRTAARRLTDARRALAARSTAEAVSIAGRRIDELRGAQ
jgi:hypothetical protein